MRGHSSTVEWSIPAGYNLSVMTIPALSRPLVRALFVDIDGTLIGADERISPRVLNRLRLAQECGVEVVLCTGRTRYRMAPIAEQIPGKPGYAVSSNGGVAAHLGTGEILYRKLMPIPIALLVIRAIVEAGSEPFVFEDSDTPGLEGARVLFHPELPVGRWADFPRYRPYDGITDDLPFEPISVSAFGHRDVMRPLAQRLADELSGMVSVIQSGSHSAWGVEIYVTDVSKQVGVSAVAERLRVDREEILAIGDHVNDIEMLQWAGVGVAMGNALPEIIDVADWVTSGVTQDGVADAIDRFILQD